MHGFLSTLRKWERHPLALYILMSAGLDANPVGTEATHWGLQDLLSNSWPFWKLMTRIPCEGKPRAAAL